MADPTGRSIVSIGDRGRRRTANGSL